MSRDVNQVLHKQDVHDQIEKLKCKITLQIWIHFGNIFYDWGQGSKKIARSRRMSWSGYYAMIMLIFFLFPSILPLSHYMLRFPNNMVSFTFPKHNDYRIWGQMFLKRLHFEVWFELRKSPPILGIYICINIHFQLGKWRDSQIQPCILGCPQQWALQTIKYEVNIIIYVLRKAICFVSLSYWILSILLHSWYHWKDLNG